METFFLNYLADLGWITYVIIFVAMLFEGEMILFTTVYLAEDHYLKMRFLTPVLFIGALTGDILWFTLGGYLEKRSAFVRHWFGKITGPINRRLDRRPSLVILVSKFTYGLNRATLMRAGAHGMEFKNFLLTDLFTIFCWMSVIGNLAYFSSMSSVYFKHYVKYAEVGLLLGILFMVICVHFFTFIARKMIAGNGTEK